MSQEQAAAKGSSPDATGASAEEEVGEDRPMSFWEHLDELRKRLVRSVLVFFLACVVGWEVREKLLHFLTVPFVEAWKSEGLAGNPSLHFGAPAAAFVAYFKLSMLGGAALASPFIFYQLWAFIAPGLYAREKKFVIPFVLFSTLLFVGGGLFGWRAAFPISFGYFLSMAGTVGSGEGVTITPTVMMGDYLDFVAQLLLGFGIIFEIPLIVLFLSIAGVVNYLQLILFGRWFVLVAFIVAALLTPPELTSQLVMAVPMCLLYVLSIGLAYVFGRPPTEAQREAYKKRKETEVTKG
ncbi:preprotein translocase subunit TatC [Sorangium cellulosum]|uniref:Sec-independent protein translocase protein TatC n=1 Tax=Sorangium cellulosum TaxID=56 RepID=A0A4P2Q1I9_SORCE|nr:twin-arginine translocase subunit TatC [Sorangium cellulosum]AUX23127.1 preprotein translocase subunit TatC [Sorangium cellulosum]